MFCDQHFNLLLLLGQYRVCTFFVETECRECICDLNMCFLYNSIVRFGTFVTKTDEFCIRGRLRTRSFVDLFCQGLMAPKDIFVLLPFLTCEVSSKVPCFSYFLLQPQAPFGAVKGGILFRTSSCLGELNILVGQILSLYFRWFCNFASHLSKWVSTWCRRVIAFAVH